MNDALLDNAAGPLWSHERLSRLGAVGTLVESDPMPDCSPDRINSKSSDLITAAVLVPLVLRGDRLDVLLTRRTEHLDDHAGQVSFPGGRIEPGDADVDAAALRESREEIGLEPSRVDILGRMPGRTTGSGFHITPVVGIINPPFDLKADAFEVAEIFEINVHWLLDAGNFSLRPRPERPPDRRFHILHHPTYDIWGATANILHDLAHGLRQI